MRINKCPGQDTRYWKAEDISERTCPYCGATIEFWKTDIRAKCPGCGRKVANPGFNLGCAEWCAYAKECLGTDMSEVVPQKLRNIVMNELARITSDNPELNQAITDQMTQAELWCREREINPLPTLASIMILRARENGLLDSARDYVEHLVNDLELPPPIGSEIWLLVSKIDEKSGRGEEVHVPEDLLA